MEADEEYSMTVEAGEVIKEIQVTVKFIGVSQILENTHEKVHINIETKESARYCVELTPKGFRVRFKMNRSLKIKVVIVIRPLL